MKKIIISRKIIFIPATIILLILFIHPSYDLYKYLRAIQIETRKTIESQKNHVYCLAFRGQVIDKEYFKEYKLNEYRLRLKIEKISQKPSINNLPLPPYYDFANDSILVISVSKKLFDKIRIGDTLSKDSMSFDINRGLEKLEYLSSKKEKWLP